MTNPTADFTERENQIIGLLSQRYEERSLDARIVTVNKLEGGEEPTLRFTLDETSSTDLERSRIANGNEPVEALAAEIASELEQPAARIGP